MNSSIKSGGIKRTLEEYEEENKHTISTPPQILQSDVNTSNTDVDMSEPESNDYISHRMLERRRP